MNELDLFRIQASQRLFIDIRRIMCERLNIPENFESKFHLGQHLLTIFNDIERKLLGPYCYKKSAR